MATATITSNADNTGKELRIYIENHFDPAVYASIIREALKTAATNYAEKWIEENNDKIMQRLNVDAISNMIMLEVAKSVKNNITTKGE